VNWKNKVDPWPQLPAAIRDCRDGGWEAADRLIALLTTIEAEEGETSGRIALRLLGATPRAVVRLDELTRRVLWRSAHCAPVIDKITKRVTTGRGGPIAVALASTHGDGRVREQAVLRMLDAPYPELMPFLLVRTNDWAREVRNRARAGLVQLLDENPRLFVPAAAEMTLLLGGRLRGGFACAQLFTAIRQAPDGVRLQLAASEDRAVRRLTFDAALSAGRFGIDELVSLADNDPDVRLRSRAAEAAVREAIWTKGTKTLRHLAKSRHREVRALALTGLVRIGLDREAASCLNDKYTLVRALARDAARRTGVDPLRHYREAVAADEPCSGAIAGLAEIGSAADAPLLQNLLGHALPQIRVRALRGLRLLNAVPIADVTGLLRDPSSAVVREATAALSRNR
jgi:HEAT repeat protein